MLFKEMVPEENLQNTIFPYDIGQINPKKGLKAQVQRYIIAARLNEMISEESNRVYINDKNRTYSRI